MPSLRLTPDRESPRECLEELIQSDGWRMFLAYVAEECQGLGYVRRIGLAFEKGGIEPQVAHRVAQEIVRFVQWPEQQLRDMKGDAES